MIHKVQKTTLNLHFGRALERLEIWAVNPWRRYSFLIIILLIGYLLGTFIGAINGVLAFMDPLGAFFAVLFLEFLVRVRRYWPKDKGYKISLSIIDTARIGFLYGLLMEGFKLL
tara:strand:- start:101 stop:442 length:342 start_codon:yes stop_codon:yes gene_type:complete